MSNYFKQVKGKRCGCGKPAIKYLMGWACADCLAIEQKISGAGRKRHASFDFGAARKEDLQDKYLHVFHISL